MKVNRLLHMVVSCSLTMCVLFSVKIIPQGFKKTNVLWKGQNMEVIDCQIGIKIKDGVNRDSVISKFQSLGFTFLNKPDKYGMAALQIPKDFKMTDALEKAKNTGLIEDTDPIVLTHVEVTPNDPNFSIYQWGLPRINAPAAWDITEGSSTDTVAILDSGIPIVNGALSHPELQNTNRIKLGINTVNATGLRDQHGHGTHVAGILSAESNNNVGITGMSWNPIVYIYKTQDSLGNGSSLTFYNAVVDAITKHVRVINYSVGQSSPNVYFSNAIALARANNILIVASAGNNSGGSVDYPAAYSTTYDNIIAVSSTDQYDNISSSSSAGSAVTIAAPGEAIFSTLPGYPVYENNANNYYGDMSGTSMAAPYVSGLASLIYSVNSSLTPAQVRNIITSNADDLGTSGFDNQYGYGRINALKCVVAAYVAAHPSYVYALNTAALSLSASNFGMVFTGSPGNGVAAGSYYCDRYVVSGSSNVSLTSPFYAWYLGGKGLSYANPNDASPYLSQTTTSTSVSYTTVFYYVKTVLATGQTVNKWVPFDPNPVAHRQFATLGSPVPFSASISGPTSLGIGVNGTWTATVTAGTPSYSYQWYYEYPGGLTPAIGGNTVIPNLPPAGY